MELATVEKQNKDSHPFIAPKSYPWLVICDGKHEERQTFFDISTNRYHIQSIPEMCNKLIYASSHGWLVLVEYKLQDCCCCLWNPISLEKIQLPQLESIDYNACTLSSSPSRDGSRNLSQSGHLLISISTEIICIYLYHVV